MEFIKHAIEFILHLNVYLSALIQQMGLWVYIPLFLVIFAESGIILIPFLPGESLLFALGMIAATDGMNIHGLALLLISAAVLGGMLNYGLGATVGKRLFPRDTDSALSQYIVKTRDFYEEHGALTIILARFIPIIRTYAPFVAGIARMRFLLFNAYNILGGIIWIALFLYASYFFGNIPVIKQYFSLLIIVIILISVIPVVLEMARYFLKSKTHERAI